MQNKINIHLVMIILLTIVLACSCSSSNTLKYRNTFTNEFFEISYPDDFTVDAIGSRDHVIIGNNCNVSVNISLIESITTSEDVESITDMIKSLEQRNEENGYTFDWGKLTENKTNTGLWTKTRTQDNFQYKCFFPRDGYYYLLSTNSHFEDQELEIAKHVMDSFIIISDPELTSYSTVDKKASNDVSGNTASDENIVTFINAHSDCYIEDDTKFVIIPNGWHMRIGNKDSLSLDTPEGKTVYISRIDLDDETYDEYRNRIINAKKNSSNLEYKDSNTAEFNDKRYVSIEYVEKSHFFFNKEEGRIVEKPNQENTASVILMRKINSNTIIQMEQQDLSMLDNEGLKKILGSLKFK